MEPIRVPFELYFICSISSMTFVFVKYSPTRRVSAMSNILIWVPNSSYNFDQSETRLEPCLIVPSSYPAAISFPDGDKSIVDTEAL